MKQSQKYWPAHQHKSKTPAPAVRDTVLEQVISANARLPRFENDRIDVFFNGVYQGKV